jgi:2-(1,2-epoxy-1,2-dihydrophenyl)acetyl-CoA isomerase
MQFKHVTLEFDGPVAILKLDHPEVMNAVSIDMLGGLGEALDELGDKARCLVVTGAGRAFCTGANLQGRNNQKPGKSNAGAALEPRFIRSCAACATCIARSLLPSTVRPPAPE